MRKHILAAGILIAFVLIPPKQASADASVDPARAQPTPALSISFIPSTSGGAEKSYRFLVFEPKSIEWLAPILVQDTPQQEAQPGQAPQQAPAPQPQEPAQQPAEPEQPYPGQVDEAPQPREGYPAEAQPGVERPYGWGYAWWWWIIIAAIIVFFIVIFAAWGGWGGGRGTRPPEDRL